MTHQDSETETIARAVGSDEMAQRTLYQAHYAAAFRLAYLLLQDACDAEEVVQDTFVYLFRNLGRYDPGRGSFWAWLRVTLVSRCRNKRRRRRLSLVALETLDAGAPSAAGDPADLLELGGAQRAMWEALQRVSPGARDALVLRYYEELSYEEIASVLGCSPDAARARVVHGKAQLRLLLTVPEGGAAKGLVSAARVKG